jgi:TRAP-type C4-dicarboxylate transport system permease small subunit
LQEAVKTMPANSKSFMRRLFCRARQLFHLLIAVVFLFFTMAGISVSMKLWQDYQKIPTQGIWGFSMVASFTVLLLIFCLYSFVKARSVR